MIWVKKQDHGIGNPFIPGCEFFHKPMGPDIVPPRFEPVGFAIEKNRSFFLGIELDEPIVPLKQFFDFALEGGPLHRLAIPAPIGMDECNRNSFFHPLQTVELPERKIFCLGMDGQWEKPHNKHDKFWDCYFHGDPSKFHRIPKKPRIPWFGPYT